MQRTEPPAPASAPAPGEWRIFGVDSQPYPRPVRRNPVAGEQAAPVAPVEPRAARVPTVAPAPSSRLAPAPRPPGPALPIVADPNGRPWPLGAAYVAGLPQSHFGGRATVVLDNTMNPAPVFVALVALDEGAPRPVRHVHVPAMGGFRIESIPPGRYEVHHRNLVTGALTRSEVFELHQIDAGHGTRASERTVALDPWARMRIPLAGSTY